VLGEFPMAGSIDRLVTREMLERSFALHESGKLLLGNHPAKGSSPTSPAAARIRVAKA